MPVNAAFANYVLDAVVLERLKEHIDWPCHFALPPFPIHVLDLVQCIPSRRTTDWVTELPMIIGTETLERILRPRPHRAGYSQRHNSYKDTGKSTDCRNCLISAVEATVSVSAPISVSLYVSVSVSATTQPKQPQATTDIHYL